MFKGVFFLAIFGLVAAKHLPSVIQADIQKIYQRLRFVPLREKLPAEPDKVNFRLFTRENPDGVEIDPSGPTIQSQNPMKFLIHDWSENSHVEYLADLTQKYLEKEDQNVIVVDWSEYANKEYVQAAALVPAVGTIVGELMIKISLPFKVLGPMHAIGFGMGAHVAGAAGQKYQGELHAKIDRITGLDASGLVFNEFGPGDRLSEDDAQFVDGVHTDGKDGFGIGYSDPYGTVDFYPNGGMNQPLCPRPGTPGQEEEIHCSHFRSVQYWNETITRPNTYYFSAKVAETYKDFLEGKATFGSVMGDDTPKTAHGKQYLRTNNVEPYGRGSDVTY